MTELMLIVMVVLLLAGFPIGCPDPPKCEPSFPHPSMPHDGPTDSKHVDVAD